jgi:hypothetical protein
MPASRSGWRSPTCSAHGAALGEAGEHEPPGGDPAPALPREQRLDLSRRLAHPLLVLAAHARERADVVPRPHHVALVDGDRPERRVREHEADARARGQAELGHDRLEVVAVGAEAVHPDHGRRRIRGGLDLDRFQQLGHVRPPSE